MKLHNVWPPHTQEWLCWSPSPQQRSVSRVLQRTSREGSSMPRGILGFIIKSIPLVKPLCKSFNKHIWQKKTDFVVEIESQFYPNPGHSLYMVRIILCSKGQCDNLGLLQLTKLCLRREIYSKILQEVAKSVGSIHSLVDGPHEAQNR